MVEEFTKRVVQIIKSIPYGRVCTYGGIAARAGSPRSARQVAWILRTQTRKHRLPWHRVIGKGGKISIKDPEGHMRQIRLLQSEGVEFVNDTIDMEKFEWFGEENTDLLD